VVGLSGVGEVAAIGSNVSGISVKDNVLALANGCWCDKAIIHSSKVFKIPGNLLLEESASISSALSAWIMLHKFSQLKAGDVVVQSHGLSSIGQAITQIGNKLQLKVVSLTTEQQADYKYLDSLKALGPIKLVVCGSSGKVAKSMMRTPAASSSLA
jgi:NADPH:quinone reductase-like Zn-dependent oxidoreductase